MDARAPRKGGARPGAGRPRISEIRTSVSLTAEQHAMALALGAGNIGAKDDADAMREAARSMRNPDRSKLQVWNREQRKYVPA